MAQRNPQTLPFERRTLIVWASLVCSLTLVTGLLMALDPTPHAPAVGPVLAVFDPSPQGLQSLLATQAPLEENRWKAIVVQHSSQMYGNAETLGQEHHHHGYGGLGYHFVIGNGDGASDGEIQAGYRWARQMEAIPVTDEDTSAWFRRHAVVICIVGDGDRSAPTQVQFDRLLLLVRALQQRLGVPADRVYLQRDIARTTSPGKLFPAASFRQQLLNVESLAGAN